MPPKHWQVWGIKHFSRCLFQDFATHWIKKWFPTSILNLPGTILCHSHVSCHWIPGRRDEHLPPQEAVQSNEVILSLLSKLDKHSDPSCCPEDIPYAPFTSFVAFLWVYSSTSKSFLNWEAQTASQLHALLQVRQHQHSIQQDNHLFWAAAGVVFDALQDGACLRGYQGTLLTPTEPSVTSNHSSLSAGLLSSHFSFIFSLNLLWPSCRMSLFSR